VNRETLNVKS